MKTTNFEKSLAELRTELALIDAACPDPLERLRLTLPMISAVLDKIRIEVTDNGFECRESEIHFFKHTKPAIYALQIYEVDLFNLHMNRPVGTPDMLRAYYEEELMYVIRICRINPFYYQYYRLGVTELDSQYFTRDGKPSDIPVPSGIDINPGFTTQLDFLFAKFMAAERYQEYLLELLNQEISLPLKPVKGRPMMRWTGESINLVEVAYGFWLTGQVNEGNATITDIILWLEEKLSVKIGLPSRRWSEISGRKNSSPTKYLDRMGEALQKRYDEEFSIGKDKRKARRK